MTGAEFIPFIPVITLLIRAGMEGRAATEEEINAALARTGLAEADRQAITAAIEADPVLADLVAQRRAAGRVQT
jgi:hypothetical protein